MPIILEDDGTLVVCNFCGTQEKTPVRNGTAPSNWLTGQVLLDVSVSLQKQYPICFCPDCRASALAGIAMKAN